MRQFWTGSPEVATFGAGLMRVASAPGFGRARIPKTAWRRGGRSTVFGGDEVAREQGEEVEGVMMNRRAELCGRFHPHSLP